MIVSHTAANEETRAADSRWISPCRRNRDNLLSCQLFTSTGLQRVRIQIFRTTNDRHVSEDNVPNGLSEVITRCINCQGSDTSARVTAQMRETSTHRPSRAMTP